MHSIASVMCRGGIIVLGYPLECSGVERGLGEVGDAWKHGEGLRLVAVLQFHVYGAMEFCFLILSIIFGK